MTIFAITASLKINALKTLDGYFSQGAARRSKELYDTILREQNLDLAVNETANRSILT